MRLLAALLMTLFLAAATAVPTWAQDSDTPIPLPTRIPDQADDGLGDDLLAVPAEPPRVTPPVVSDSPFGVVIVPDPQHLTVDEDMAAIRKAGIRWVRFQPDWTQLEPTRGKYDWSLSDAVVKAARKENLSLVMTLGYTPRWASKFSDVDEVDVWNKNAPKDMSDWNRLLTALARRYGNDVKVWQAWERSAIQFFRGSDREMRDLIRVTTQTSHKIHGDEMVVLPEEGSLDLGAINRYYSWNMDPFFDVLGLYPMFDKPEKMIRPLRTLREDVVRKKGPLKSLWFTAIGWNTKAATSLLKDPVASEDEQARYLIRGMTLGLGNGVERIFWQAWRDRESDAYQVSTTAGLVRADGSSRPALRAYETLIGALQGKKRQGQAAWGAHRFGHLFTGGGESALVAWSDSGEARMPLGAEMKISDASGQSRTTDTVTLSENPVIITGPPAALEKLLSAAPTPAAAPDADFSGASAVQAVLSKTPEESGLHVARYGQLGAGAVRVVEKAGAAGWQTKLSEGKALIYFDVDDSFLYFVDGKNDVEVEVEVAANENGQKVGFNVGYDGMEGYTFTPWQWVDGGTGWKTYRFRISNADFSDNFSDFRINAFGSKGDVTVRRVLVRKLPGTARKETPQGASRT